jgi:two-component system KDP operon response regulator KdpE
MSKPFAAGAGRIELALRRRPESHANDKAVSIDGLTVNFAERRVTLDGEEIQLSATEYKLLSELVAHAGLVLTHSQILQRVWGPNYGGEVALVRTFIRNLRQKLGDDAIHSRYIITHPGIGYRWQGPLSPLVNSWVFPSCGNLAARAFSRSGLGTSSASVRGCRGHVDEEE